VNLHPEPFYPLWKSVKILLVQNYTIHSCVCIDCSLKQFEVILTYTADLKNVYQKPDKIIFIPKECKFLGFSSRNVTKGNFLVKNIPAFLAIWISLMGKGFKVHP